MWRLARGGQAEFTVHTIRVMRCLHAGPVPRQEGEPRPLEHCWSEPWGALEKRRCERGAGSEATHAEGNMEPTLVD